MTKAEFAKTIDHAMLWQDTPRELLKKRCADVVKYGFACICCFPSDVPIAKEIIGDKGNICAVVGYPMGMNTTETKVFETKDAVSKGADEIDMVINVGLVKNKQYDKVLEEIKAVKEACGGKLLKVIIEACYLTDDEKIMLCKLVTEAKAEYIKTSTGFGTGGATAEDIIIFKDNIGENVKMKAAGGIRTKEDMEKFIELGCSRIGTSGAVKALSD